MTETGASAGPCHERLVFPWTGVLLRDETIEDLVLPSSTSQVELMCYELAPYAAALARLRPGFAAAANSRSAGGSEY